MIDRRGRCQYVRQRMHQHIERSTAGIFADVPAIGDIDRRANMLAAVIMFGQAMQYVADRVITAQISLLG